jgi:hypothetical protein
LHGCEYRGHSGKQKQRGNQTVRKVHSIKFFSDFKHESRFEKGVGIGAALFKPFRHLAWRRDYRRNGNQPQPSALDL